VQQLQRKDLQIDSQGVITVTFERCKGGKSMVDKLPKDTSQILIDWLKSYYGDNVDGFAPVWVSLSVGGHEGNSYGQQLSVRSFTEICKKYLNTGKVHRTRHTWTVNMIKEGASLQLIKKKLGHESLATTGLYADSLEQEDNPFAEGIARRAGIKQGRVNN
jgi:integrase